MFELSFRDVVFLLIGVVGGELGYLLLIWLRKRLALPPQSQMLVDSGAISKRPESKVCDSTYVAFMARSFDDSSAPQEIRDNADHVQLIGGPFDGCVGIFPPGQSDFKAFVMPVHRNLKRFVIYRHSDSSDNWEGSNLTKHREYRFDRFILVKGPSEAFQELRRLESECSE